MHTRVLYGSQIKQPLLVLTTKKQCVYSAVRTEYLNIIYVNFRFSPCIIIVSHFYCSTNALNIQNLEVKIYVV